MKTRRAVWMSLVLVLILVTSTTLLAAAQSRTWLPVVGANGTPSDEQYPPEPLPDEPAPPEEAIGAVEQPFVDDGTQVALPGAAEADYAAVDGSAVPATIGNDGLLPAIGDAPTAYDVATWRVVNSVGIGTDVPGSRLDINFGATGRTLAATPLGNGPGWIYYAANGHRRDMTAWNGGLYLAASTTNGAANPAQFVIHENGNVGIGTTAPASKLEVNFGATGRTLAATPLGNGPGWIYYAANGHRRDMTAWNGGLYFAASTTNGAANPAQFVIRENGYIGMNTTSPTGPLDISFGATGHTVAGTPGGNGPGWLFYAANGHRRDLTAWNGGFYLGASPNAAAAPAHVVVRENGFVGVGTINPVDKLHVVNGNIRVSGGSFIDDGIALNVPDYVFEPNYALMSLDELRTYVTTEKHLPNVPSQAQIKANGLNVSQFNMALLEKAEELTLYTLEQQEQIESLEAKLSAQQEQITTLQAQMAALLAR